MLNQTTEFRDKSPKRDAADTRFRADSDGVGRWSVWQRLGESGWVLRTPCSTRAEALGLAATLNRDERVAG